MNYCQQIINTSAPRLTDLGEQMENESWTQTTKTKNEVMETATHHARRGRVGLSQDTERDVEVMR